MSKSKNLFKSTAFILTYFLLAGAVSAYPVDINGDLGDWGVTPFSHWQPDSLTARWQEDNYTGSGSFPNGGEDFDIETLYADIDCDTGFLYLAVILSMPQAGVDDPYGRQGVHYFAGDIALDLDNDSSTGEYGYEYGLGTHFDSVGQVLFNPDWELPSAAYGIPANTPSTMVDGTYVADGLIAYVNAGDLEGNGTDTYIIEASILLSDLGVVLEEGDEIGVHFTIDCGNDVIDLDCPVGAPVPEPYTLLGIGMGLVVVTGVARRKLSQR